MGRWIHVLNIVIDRRSFVRILQRWYFRNFILNVATYSLSWLVCWATSLNSPAVTLISLVVICCHRHCSAECVGHLFVKPSGWLRALCGLHGHQGDWCSCLVPMTLSIVAFCHFILFVCCIPTWLVNSKSEGMNHPQMRANLLWFRAKFQVCFEFSSFHVLVPTVESSDWVSIIRQQ